MSRTSRSCARCKWLIIAFAIPVFANDASDKARQHLRAAIDSADKNDLPKAEAELFAVISNPGFAALAPSAQHTALALSASLNLKTGKFQDALQLSRRATEMPQQSVDDWRVRLSAAMKLGDRRDEAQSAAAIARRWGRDSESLPNGTIMQVLRDTAHGEASEARFDFLQALYEGRWRPSDGSSMNTQWVELSRLLLERSRSEEAYIVASLVDDPRSVISFHADRRLQPLLKSKLVHSDPQRTARDRIEALRAAVKQQPRSLLAVRRLVAALSSARQDAEAIKLSEQAEARSFDDPDGLGELLDLKASALRNLGRDEQAVHELQRAVTLRHGSVSQSIDLAALLCALGRSSEGLPLLPPDSQVSEFGKMMIALVRLTAAIDSGSAADRDKQLTYLREHRLDGPGVAQSALLRAGALDEAEQTLLWRLNDPALRTNALLSMQHYFEAHRPPRAAEWRTRELELENRPSIRSAVSLVGQIDHYPWTYGYD